MTESIRYAITTLKLMVNYLTAVMLLIIFLAFCINVILRYTLGVSFGWIVESSLILWIWVIFLGAGIFLEEDDHVSFVYMYRAFRKKVRLSLKTLSYIIVFVGGVFMLAPVWDYISFLKIRHSDVIGIPMNYVFFVYKIFLVALILRYGNLVRKNAHDLFYVDHTEEEASSTPPTDRSGR